MGSHLRLYGAVIRTPKTSNKLLAFISSRHNDVPIIHNKVIPVVKKKPVEVVVTEIKMTFLTVAQLAQCIIEEYNKCGPVRGFDICHPISIKEWTSNWAQSSKAPN